MTLRNSPGCHGRCCGGVSCCCVGQRPNKIRVTISGVTSGGIYDCSEFNSTFDLELDPDLGDCGWIYILGGSGLFERHVAAEIVRDSPSSCILRVTIKTTTQAFTYEYDFSDEETCCDLDADIPYVTSSGPLGCSGSGATVHAEAICYADCEEVCDNGEGPEEFQLDSSSWGDGLSCSDCNEVLNGTFTLTRADQACTWISNYFTFCGDSLTHWTLAIGVGQVLVSLRNGIGTILWQWSWTHDGDCLNWTTVALTHSYTNLIYADYCYAVGALDITSL